MEPFEPHRQSHKLGIAHVASVLLEWRAQRVLRGDAAGRYSQAMGIWERFKSALASTKVTVPSQPAIALLTTPAVLAHLHRS
jgi:hypothetical protein